SRTLSEASPNPVSGPRRWTVGLLSSAIANTRLHAGNPRQPFHRATSTRRRQCGEVEVLRPGWQFFLKRLVRGAVACKTKSSAGNSFSSPPQKIERRLLRYI